jgi:hypothetical protein
MMIISRLPHDGSRKAKLAPPAFLGIAFLIALGAILGGCGGDRASVPLEKPKATPSYIPGLSLDQSRAVEQYGYPDHFFLSFDPGGSDRIERWTYFSQGKALDFVNGRLSGEDVVEDESSRYPPCGLHPQDFTATMTPEEAAVMLGEPLYSQEKKDSLMPENSVLVFEKAVLLYKSGQLIGVDTQVRPPRIPAP